MTERDGSKVDSQSYQSGPRLWVRLVIAMTDFGALIYFLDLKVRSGVPVDGWIIMLLVGILGSMLGLDLLKEIGFRGQ